jgi:hypothetical protein
VKEPKIRAADTAKAVFQEDPTPFVSGERYFLESKRSQAGEESPRPDSAEYSAQEIKRD